MDATKIIVAQVEKFLSFLKSLNENDLSALENGSQKIVFSLGNKKSSSSRNENGVSAAEIELIFQTLNSLESREQGFELIDNLNRSTLEKLCRMAELSFTKKDPTPKLKNKIIEGTIGFRLNSKAIQQIN